MRHSIVVVVKSLRRGCYSTFFFRLGCKSRHQSHSFNTFPKRIFPLLQCKFHRLLDVSRNIQHPFSMAISPVKGLKEFHHCSCTNIRAIPEPTGRRSVSDFAIYLSVSVNQHLERMEIGHFKQEPCNALRFPFCALPINLVLTEKSSLPCKMAKLIEVAGGDGMAELEQILSDV